MVYSIGTMEQRLIILWPVELLIKAWRSSASPGFYADWWVLKGTKGRRGSPSERSEKMKIPTEARVKNSPLKKARTKTSCK